ncbi:cation:H+ antiporter [Hoeflea halophila]|uniref:Cation:H+ antiporter n=1 Tax=Hoeflea halophila TaxID=714899 RepID=A0A286IAK7_9HYPH|nr:sodium:calcium antiporter [Hoeflea halophila]SOE17145.1 cation:H+ antiporter [Hoeflea halophila]
MFASLSTSVLFALGGLAGLVILVSGYRMTGLSDQIADRTGLGEALVGAALLGAATSMSGTVVSLTSALDGRASLAFSNGIGGIAAQTAFLAVADMIYRRANLEHAAADLANVFQAGLLLLLLTVPLMAFTAPEIAVWGIHPASIALFIIYVLGMRATARLREEPMWHPVTTPDTRADRPEDDREAEKSAYSLVLPFLALLVLMALAGWSVARIAAEISDRLELSDTVVGATMTAVLTSLPELVTTLVAVRRGALQLAVGGIIGGNTFDTLFLTLSDIGYRDGSLYHAITADDLFWLTVAMLMTAILSLGLIYRERRGIGWESTGLLVVYIGALGLQVM